MACPVCARARARVAPFLHPVCYSHPTPFSPAPQHPAHAPLSFILSAYSTQEDMVHLCANVVILLVLIVPKMPALEGVRLFGVNKGPEE